MSGTGFVGVTRRLRLHGLRLNGQAVTAVGDGESVAYATLLADRSPYLSGSATHEKSGTWYADIVLPATPQILHVHWTVTVGGAVEKWHDTITVEDFV